MLDDLLQPGVLDPIEQSIDVSLQEAYSGNVRPVTLQRRELCPKCLGRGLHSVLSLPCGKCNTQGSLLITKTIQLHIPAGADTGTRLRIHDDSAEGLMTEFLVVFRVLPDSSFSRQGHDLFTTLEISSDQARSGDTASVILPNGKRIGFSLAPNSSDGSVLPLIGRGMPYLNEASRRGDLYVKIRIAGQQPSFPSAHNAPTEASVSPEGAQTSFGHYHVIRHIGEGGCGAVYLGKHRYLNSQVAIKVLKNISDQQNFLHEAQTVAALKHPHILRVLDFGIEGATPYLVMDYAGGGSLRDRHPHGSRISFSQVVSYTKQIAEALQHAHHQRIIHRDIKPDNLLLDAENSVLLTDFGIAIAAHTTRSMKLEEPYGTLYYVAPEQLSGQPRPQSDQYALGIVIYEWLCGRCPFEGTLAEVLHHHHNSPPPALRNWNPAIKPSIEWVVLKALAKDPHQRFNSVQAFAQALEAAGQR